MMMLFFWVLALQGFSPEDGDSMFSKMLPSTDKSTRRQDPEEQHNPHCHENLKSHNILRCLHFINTFILPEGKTN
jgi:hypothetical protein